MSAAPAPQLAPTFADPAQLAVWFERMPVRGWVTYACAPFLPVRHPVVVLVQKLRDEGRATFAQQKSDRAPGFYEYRLQKLAWTPPGATLAPGAIEARLLLVLADCAAHGLQCPSNEVLAEVLGLAGPRQARHRFNRLERLGHVRVIEPARFGARVIEIVATGARTACPKTGRGQ